MGLSAKVAMDHWNELTEGSVWTIHQKKKTRHNIELNPIYIEGSTPRETNIA